MKKLMSKILMFSFPLLSELVPKTFPLLVALILTLIWRSGVFLRADSRRGLPRKEVEYGGVSDSSITSCSL